MTDDQIYNYISDLIDGVITRDVFWELAKFKYPTHQIVLCSNKAPTIWEIGRVYTRLIAMVNSDENEYINTLLEILSSWIIPEIDNYNSSL